MSQRLPTAVVEFVKVWGLLTLLVVAGFVATYQYVGAPPPRAIRIATGSPNGAYYAFAQRYARLLAEDGITLEVVETAGSVANLELLRRGEVTLALVQGGSATREDRERLQSLGSLFLEPVWVFTRADAALARLSELKGERLAVGAAGSGTHLLATQLLSASGVNESNATLIPADAGEAARLMRHGRLTAAFQVASPDAPFIQDLLQEPAIGLFDFERAAAYGQLFPFLTPIVLSEGVLDLERNVPPRDTALVAVAAGLVARRDLNVSLIPALLDAVTRVHHGRSMLDPQRRFPSVDLVDIPLNEVAGHYLAEGPSFLYRWLPYGTAVRLDRLKILILPLLALLLPLFRVAPPLYQWRIRSKIYRWYGAVREIDAVLAQEPSSEQARSVSDRLKTLEHEVASVSVPLAYAGELYHLRLHIRLLQEQLERLVHRAS